MRKAHYSLEEIQHTKKYFPDAVFYKYTNHEQAKVDKGINPFLTQAATAARKRQREHSELL